MHTPRCNSEVSDAAYTVYPGYTAPRAPFPDCTVYEYGNPYTPARLVRHDARYFKTAVTQYSYCTVNAE